MSMKRWLVSDTVKESERFSHQSGLPSLVCAVLLSRGMSTAEQLADFTNDESEIESPFALKDMDKAVERIWRAIESDEKICIYGDYDCDGITATALLMSYLESVGGQCEYYIPDRETEGYGLNTKAIDTVASHGVTLLVTVDNAVNAHHEIAHASSLGIDTVVTDHHTVRESLPAAYAVVNPHRADDTSLFKDLAGVGVAFQLVCALEDAQADEMLSLYADLVAIGTIADVVPLVGANRAIVQAGLELLSEPFRPGISALLSAVGISSEAPLTSETIAFGIAPRLNAAGRVGKVEHAVELLLTDDDEYAQTLVESLLEYNLQRRGLEEVILTEVESLLKAEPEILKKRLLIVSGEGWHPGVLGIVAARLLDLYGKPCFVFSKTADKLRGSGRSLAGYHLIEAVHACAKHLTHYGGHAMAAGATLEAKNLPDFIDQLEEYSAKNYSSMPVPSVHVSAVLQASWLTVEHVKALSILGPFGEGNEAPLFMLKGVQIMGISPTKDGKHLRLRLSVEGKETNAIYFRMAEGKFPYRLQDTVDVVVSLEVSLWNGSERLSVRVADLRRTGVPQEELIHQHALYQNYARGEAQKDEKGELLPSRDELALVFRYLRQSPQYPFGELALYEHFLQDELAYGKLLVAVDVFEELGLLTRQGGTIALSPASSKVNLEDSRILKNLQS